MKRVNKITPIIIKLRITNKEIITKRGIAINANKILLQNEGKILM